MQWLSYEKDTNGNPKLKENTPKEIKVLYEEYLQHYKKYKENFLEDYK